MSPRQSPREGAGLDMPPMPSSGFGAGSSGADAAAADLPERVARREREIAAMTTIAQSTAISLKRMKDQNEALQFSIAALDSHTNDLQEQVRN